MAISYLLICVANIFFIDRQITYVNTEQTGYNLRGEDEPSKITRLHKSVLDERRKLVSDDVLLSCYVNLVWFFNPKNTPLVFHLVDLSLRSKARSPIFLLHSVFRI
jgi:hypothetical protein